MEEICQEPEAYLEGICVGAVAINQRMGIYHSLDDHIHPVEHLEQNCNVPRGHCCFPSACLERLDVMAGLGTILGRELEKACKSFCILFPAMIYLPGKESRVSIGKHPAIFVKCVGVREEIRMDA